MLVSDCSGFATPSTSCVVPIALDKPLAWWTNTTASFDESWQSIGQIKAYGDIENGVLRSTSVCLGWFPQRLVLKIFLVELCLCFPLLYITRIKHLQYQHIPPRCSRSTLELLLIDPIRGVHDSTLSGTVGVEVLPCNSAQMLLQSLFTSLVLSMSLVNLLQAVAHQELIVSRCEDRCGHVDKDRDPGVAATSGEGLAAEEDRRNHTSAEIPCQIGGDGIA